MQCSGTTHVRQAAGLAQGEHGRAVADAVGRHALEAHLLQQPLRLPVVAGPPARRHGVVVADRLVGGRGCGAKVTQELEGVFVAILCQ